MSAQSLRTLTVYLILLFPVRKISILTTLSTAFPETPLTICPFSFPFIFSPFTLQPGPSTISISIKNIRSSSYLLCFNFPGLCTSGLVALDNKKNRNRLPDLFIEIEIEISLLTKSGPQEGIYK